jgi:hypothetical protein
MERAGTRIPVTGRGSLRKMLTSGTAWFRLEKKTTTKTEKQDWLHHFCPRDLLLILSYFRT